jgi:DNA-binding transcriptional ArsR family regulator
MNGPPDENGPACRIFARGETAMEKIELSDSALELIAGRFRLLAEPMRLKILHTLGEDEMSVSELVAATGANQANISKHLGILLDAGIVARRKEGLRANYRVKDESIFVLCDAVCSRLQTQLEMHKHALSNIRKDR